MVLVLLLGIGFIILGIFYKGNNKIKTALIIGGVLLFILSFWIGRDRNQIESKADSSYHYHLNSYKL
jgi:hypothetical protein